MASEILKRGAPMEQMKGTYPNYEKFREEEVPEKCSNCGKETCAFGIGKTEQFYMKDKKRIGFLLTLNPNGRNPLCTECLTVFFNQLTNAP